MQFVVKFTPKQFVVKYGAEILTFDWHFAYFILLWMSSVRTE